MNPQRTTADTGIGGLRPCGSSWSQALPSPGQLLLSNRLILTPSAEFNAAFSDDEEIGVGAGLSSMELGLRLSYDLIDRSVSPYLGVVYERSFGRTADFAAEHGEPDQAWFAVAGVRLMF